MDRIAPLRLPTPRRSTLWLDEPELLFAGDAKHTDPMVGVPLYGPRSFGTSRHRQEVHVGLIGTADAAEHGRQLLEGAATGVPGDEAHAPFPGCYQGVGYRCDLRFDDQLLELITRKEQLEILDIKRGKDRFETMLQTLCSKLDILNRKDRPLDYVLVVLPDDLFKRCRVTEYTVKGERFHRDLRRAFKASAMRARQPTQILLDTTTGLVPTTRQLDHASVIAWNLFTGLYFKVDGLPWGPTGLAPGTCFVGVSFFRPLGEGPSTLRTSVVQAFDENGEGLVLRGHDFHWDEQRQGRSPHLPADAASDLVQMVLRRYQEEQKQPPRRIVVHKTSRFEGAELAGFDAALKSVGQYDLVALRPTSEVRLVRAGRYPPLRGTTFTVGDISYVYTTGYLSEHGRYPHGHVPSPIQVADHVGDTPKTQLLRELMILTKMNWNSATYAEASPITLRFAELVGDILREVPGDQVPEPKYKFYM